MASITCKCGECKIQFKQAANLWRLECCCFNCTSAPRNFHQTQGSEAPPDPPCMDSIWFPNDFTVTGQDKMGAQKLFEGADTTRFYCKECFTILMADHPVYAGKVVVTQATNYQHEAIQGAELCEPKARHFCKDLSDEQVAQLPKWSGADDVVYQGCSENLPNFGEHPEGATGDQNAQLLAETLGVTFAKEAQEGPPTVMQQMAAAAAAEEAAP